ncbi:hypothetical protein RHGRI_019237 [Rhododendron griersonianum]|uniref:Uncharacterized protein n=1 Tax=Rhododendron griersonianum TaxID=479676 RepID=A0AAV6JH66_9ERIC|nr:hypothetical protein RHGRI_019237 [Rhododendron griersonianum]
MHVVLPPTSDLSRSTPVLALAGLYQANEVHGLIGFERSVLVMPFKRCLEPVYDMFCMWYFMNVLLLTAVCDCSILCESALGMKLLVEKVFGASQPDILEIEKAKKMLKLMGIATGLEVRRYRDRNP